MLSLVVNPQRTAPAHSLLHSLQINISFSCSVQKSFTLSVAQEKGSQRRCTDILRRLAALSYKLNPVVTGQVGACDGGITAVIWHAVGRDSQELRERDHRMSDAVETKATASELFDAAGRVPVSEHGYSTEKQSSTVANRTQHMQTDQSSGSTSPDHRADSTLLHLKLSHDDVTTGRDSFVK